ncbi:hypothetical protein [Thalassobacillus sp. CUG 92003]|uniref:hypothetical protein n=1 Tax=Thalassobacillus sp. CUG 92003 TaxID=2736641 RepID=UPI0015E77BA9|nr:hypothetical protein [Thalassobacillus sp. CUG 92003]
MTKKHYIYDDELKVEREYAEVGGEASVGDYVYDPLEGPVSKVTYVTALEYQLNGIFYFDKSRMRKLAPTGNVRVPKPDGSPGETYALTDRKADVGERIIITHPNHRGRILEVTEVKSFGDFVSSTPVDGIGGIYPYCRTDEYTVLEPIEPAQSPPQSSAPASPEQLFANLVRRVAELEQKVRVIDNYNDENDAIRRDLQTFAQVAEQAKYQAKHARDLSEDNSKDIITLDERTQPESLAEAVAKEQAESKRKFDAAKAEYFRKGGCV